MDKETKQMFELVLSNLGKLADKFEAFEERFDVFGEKFDAFEERLDVFAEKLDELQDRQDDIYRTLRAIEHKNEVNGAELEHLKVRNAKVEGTLRKISQVIAENVG
ncbi:hypothetical protein [Zhaonella formicivorans]|uniref:hypothetical protein n=1 Tax=Zhaonella formicivorans TaxID=2528593 RepID=UPI0010E7EB3E|nr:hypothetical protein [Zhaonella formicivorans]